MGKGTKNITFYFLMVLIFGSLMYFIVKEGESIQLEIATQSIQNAAPKNMGKFQKYFPRILSVTLSVTPVC